jgi:hypothetical protein
MLQHMWEFCLVTECGNSHPVPGESLTLGGRGPLFLSFLTMLILLSQPPLLIGPGHGLLHCLCWANGNLPALTLIWVLYRSTCNPRAATAWLCWWCQVCASQWQPWHPCWPTSGYVVAKPGSSHLFRGSVSHLLHFKQGLLCSDKPGVVSVACK